MRYLITGHKGFIGSNLYSHLQSNGDFVVGIDLPHNLCNIVPKSINVDTVVHLTASTGVRESIKYPKKVFINNCRSTQVALEIAKINGAKFIFASSRAADNPISPYGASKSAGEALCNAYRNSYEMDISILRLSNVYGPHSWHKSSVIAKFIKNILNDDPLIINGDGTQTRDFVHVKDVVNAILYTNSELRTVCSGEITSINELVSMLSSLADELLEKRVYISYSSEIPGEIKNADSITTTSKIPLSDGLKSTFEWFIKYEKALSNHI